MLYSNIVFFSTLLQHHTNLLGSQDSEEAMSIALLLFQPSYTTFLLDLHCSKWPRCFFCRCLSPMIVHLRNLFLLSIRVALKARIRHNQAHPRITQAYSGIFKTLCNSGIFRTVAYTEPWYIQNQKHIQNPQHIHKPGIFKKPLFSERWHIQNLRHIQNPVKHLRWSVLQKIVNGYNYFRKL